MGIIEAPHWRPWTSEALLDRQNAKLILDPCPAKMVTQLLLVVGIFALLRLSVIIFCLVLEKVFFSQEDCSRQGRVPEDFFCASDMSCEEKRATH